MPQPDCPIHHPKKQSTKADAKLQSRAGQEPKEQALANATGMRACNHRRRRSSPIDEAGLSLLAEQMPVGLTTSGWRWSPGTEASEQGR